jgi:hypothetical protein
MFARATATGVRARAELLSRTYPKLKVWEFHMPLTVTIDNPKKNGDPLPGTLRALVTGGGQPGLTVRFVLVDEADGTKTHPPLVATFVNGGWEALAVGVIPLHFYTVVAVALDINNSGVIVDSGSSGRIKCKA